MALSAVLATSGAERGCRVKSKCLEETRRETCLSPQTSSQWPVVGNEHSIPCAHFPK